MPTLVLIIGLLVNGVIIGNRKPTQPIQPKTTSAKCASVKCGVIIGD